MRNLKERKNRIIARGELSNHAHIITGECEIIEKNESVIIKAGKNCAIKHLLESEFLKGKEIWTGEHEDIELIEGESYEYVQQIQYNPYKEGIERVID